MLTPGIRLLGDLWHQWWPYCSHCEWWLFHLNRQKQKTFKPSLFAFDICKLFFYKADAAGRSASKLVSLTSGVLTVGKIHTAGTIAPHLVRLDLVRNTKRQEDKKTEMWKDERQTAGKIHTAGTIAPHRVRLDLVRITKRRKDKKTERWKDEKTDCWKDLHSLLSVLPG